MHELKITYKPVNQRLSASHALEDKQIASTERLEIYLCIV